MDVNNLSLIIMAMIIWMIVRVLPRGLSLKLWTARLPKSAPKGLINEVEQRNNNDVVSSSKLRALLDVGGYCSSDFREIVPLNHRDADKLLLQDIINADDHYLKNFVSKMSVDTIFHLVCGIDSQKRTQFVNRLPTIPAVKERLLLAAEVKKLQK